MLEQRFNIFDSKIIPVRKSNWKALDEVDLFIDDIRIKYVRCFWDVHFKTNSVISCILETEDKQIWLYDLKYLDIGCLEHQANQVKEFCYNNFIKTVHMHRVPDVFQFLQIFCDNLCFSMDDPYKINVKELRLETSHHIYQGNIKMHSNILNNTSIVDELLNAMNETKHYDYSALDTIILNLQNCNQVVLI